MIGKVLQEIEESSEDKEKRAEIRRKKRQVQKFFLENGLIWREPKRPDGIPLRVVGTKEQRNRILSEFTNSIGLDIEEHGQLLRGSSKDIGGRICTKMSRSSRKAARNVKSTPGFDTEMSYIRHSHRQSTSSGWST